MAFSVYKNQRLPHKGHLCAICGLQTRGRTVPVQLTHGVSLWLCPRHASDDFLLLNLGRDFVTTISRIWQAAGCYTRDRQRALDTHLRQFRRRPTRPEAELPGSYTWKALRNEAEHRFAHGEALASVIADLRRRHQHDVADAPSERTIRRWFHDGRWRRGIRTRLRPDYETRDQRHAAHAQKDRTATRRLRQRSPDQPPQPAQPP